MLPAARRVCRRSGPHTEVALDDISKTHGAHGVDLERLRPPDALGLGVDKLERR